MKRSLSTSLPAAVAIILAVSGWRAYSTTATADSSPDDSRTRITIVDDMGRTVELPHPVRRAVVFQRQLAEFIRGIGADETIVGMSASAADAGPEYWPRFDPANVVGNQSLEPDYERIVQLRPDVVIGEGIGNWQRHVDKLAPFGIPYVAVEGAWNQRVHVQSVRLLGEMFQKPEGAARLIAYHDDMKRLLAERLATVERRKTVYYESHGQKAAYKTALPGSGWHDMVVSGGGINLFGDFRIEDFRGEGNVHGVGIDPEAILVRNPDAVIKLEPGASRVRVLPPTSAELLDTYRWLLARPGWDRLTAVRERRVLVISDVPANLSGKMLGSVYVAKMLYPDRFRDVDPDDLLRQWYVEFQRVPYPGRFHYPVLPGQH